MVWHGKNSKRKLRFLWQKKSAEVQPVTQVVEVVEVNHRYAGKSGANRDNPEVSMKERTGDRSARRKQQELVEELFDRKSPVMPEISVHKGNPVLPIILWVVIVVIAAL